MIRRAAVMGLILALAASTCAWGQGFLLVTSGGDIAALPRPIIIWPPYPPPRPPVPPPRPRPRPQPETVYSVDQLHVNARLNDQVAQVEVTQTFRNTGSRQIEAQFVFPLPYEGAIDQLTFMVDGKEIPGRMLPADEARRKYEEIVRRNRDPALLEWVGWGMFQTSVFPIPPGEKRTVSLHYSYLCRSFEGMTDFFFPLSAAKYSSKPLSDLSIRVSIRSQAKIKNVYSPTHDVEIDRRDSGAVTVEYNAKDTIPANDFRLLFDVSRGALAAQLLSYKGDEGEGYFLLLASPEVKPQKEQSAKTVVFVIDRSGSMSGKKIEQVKEALRFVLNNLDERDLFNIIAYDSDVESFRPELQRYDSETRREAMAFVDDLYAGGSTNIDAALKTAFSQLRDEERANYVVFLTDGLPTTGVTDEAQIVKNAEQANSIRARLFSFGVGFDVNSRLLDRLARLGHGQSEFVLPDEDLEERVSRFYRRIQAPVLTNCEVEFVLDGASDRSPVSRLYPKPPFDLFAGEQLVLVGRYRRAGKVKVELTGEVNGEREKHTFRGRFVADNDDERSAFVEKLWAIRRVGEILDEIDLHGKNQELIRELVDLATKHGILTPYTSFLADENVPLTDLAGNVDRADRRLEALSVAEGYGGFMQRAGKGSLQRATTADADQARMAFAAPAPAAESRLGGSFGGGLGGYAGPAPAVQRGANAAPPTGPRQAPRGYSLAEPDSAEEQAAVSQQEAVRYVGNRVFYRRDGQWIDGTLTAEQQKKPIRIKQFSDEYFELIREHGRSVNQYLVFDEPTLVNIDKQAYLIEP